MKITDTVKDVIAGITHDFANKAYVTKVLDDVCKEEGLTDIRERIYVGENGGVSYRLFPGSYADYPVAVEFRLACTELNSWNQYIDAIGAYMRAIENYLTTAETFATTRGFELVKGGGYGVAGASLKGILDRFAWEFYQSGIGKGNSIGSAERLVEFITMLKEGNGTLNEKLQIVLEKAKPLPDCQPKTTTT